MYKKEEFHKFNNGDSILFDYDDEHRDIRSTINYGTYATRPCMYACMNCEIPSMKVQGPMAGRKKSYPIAFSGPDYEIYYNNMIKLYNIRLIQDWDE